MISDPQTKSIRAFLEKPATIAQARTHTNEFHINAGTYIINPDILATIPAGRAVSIERETFPGLLQDQRQLSAFAGQAYWLDLGTPDKYLRAHLDLLSGQLNWPVRGSQAVAGVFAAATCQIAATVDFSGQNCLGERVKIAPNCQITNSVILADAVLETGACLSGTIIGSHARIGPGVKLKAGTVIGDYSQVYT